MITSTSQQHLPLWKMMEFVNGFRMTSHIYIYIYIMENKKQIFETTNQWLLTIIYILTIINHH